MSPERAEYVNGSEVNEYCWNGKMVVYVDNYGVEMTFEAAVSALREGRDIIWTVEPPAWRKPKS